MYINLSTGNTLLRIFVKLVFMYIYMYYNNSPVDVPSQTFYKFKTPRKNSSPIVLIKIPTIVLKEGGVKGAITLKPPVIFGITPKIVPIE